MNYKSVPKGGEEVKISEIFVDINYGSPLTKINPVWKQLPCCRFGTKLGSDPVLEDMMWASLTDKLPNVPMGVTAENLAVKYGLTREEVDAFALRSQTTWGKANEGGVFKVRQLGHADLISFPSPVSVGSLKVFP